MTAPTADRRTGGAAVAGGLLLAASVGAELLHPVQESDGSVVSPTLFAGYLARVDPRRRRAARRPARAPAHRRTARRRPGRRRGVPGRDRSPARLRTRGGRLGAGDRVPRSRPRSWPSPSGCCWWPSDRCCWGWVCARSGAVGGWWTALPVAGGRRAGRAARRAGARRRPVRPLRRLGRSRRRLAAAQPPAGGPRHGDRRLTAREPGQPPGRSGIAPLAPGTAGTAATAVGTGGRGHGTAGTARPDAGTASRTATPSWCWTTGSSRRCATRSTGPPPSRPPRPAPAHRRPLDPGAVRRPADRPRGGGAAAPRRGPVERGDRRSACSSRAPRSSAMSPRCCGSSACGTASRPWSRPSAAASASDRRPRRKAAWSGAGPPVRPPVQPEGPRQDRAEAQDPRRLPRVGAEPGPDVVLVAGLDGEQDVLAVADRPAQEDEPLVHQAVHEARRAPSTRVAPGGAAPGPRTAP